MEQLHESAYFYWYNRLRKLRKKATNSEETEKAVDFKVQFDIFRKEAVRRKALVKARKMPLADFSAWLVEQQSVADGLME